MKTGKRLLSLLLALILIVGLFPGQALAQDPDEGSIKPVEEPEPSPAQEPGPAPESRSPRRRRQKSRWKRTSPSFPRILTFPGMHRKTVPRGERLRPCLLRTVRSL